MKLLITGASGLVGTRLTEVASHAGHDVVVTYNHHQVEGFNAIRADLTNEQQIRRVMQASSPDAVIHLASITDVDLCERDPELANVVNAESTRVIAEECLKAASYLVNVSTDYVFDGGRGNYREDDQPNPVNTYGSSKLKGEEATRATSDEFCVARTSVVYGWGRGSRPNFGSWVYSELKSGRRVKVVTNQYCSPTLSSHLARMLLEVAERQIPGTIHLAGSSRLNRYEFAQEIAAEFGMNMKLIIPTDAKSSTWIAERPFDSSLNVEKAQQLLSNKPMTIKMALHDFVLERQI